jgi:hypothetical protein
MRLSDLVHATAKDVDGKEIGAIHDVRMSRTGPVIGDFGASYAIDGILIGTTDIASRLGFDRRVVQGPAPLGALFRWMFRKTKYAEWKDIESVGDGIVTLRVRAAELSSPEPLPTARS